MANTKAKRNPYIKPNAKKRYDKKVFRMKMVVYNSS